MEKKLVAKITFIQVYLDGSGAPAVVECDGHKWACDFLGGPNLTIHYIPRRKDENIRLDLRFYGALSLAKQVYYSVVDDFSPEWHVKNKAMYRPEEVSECA